MSEWMNEFHAESISQKTDDCMNVLIYLMALLWTYQTKKKQNKLYFIY